MLGRRCRAWIWLNAILYTVASTRYWVCLVYEIHCFSEAAPAAWWLSNLIIESRTLNTSCKLWECRWLASVYHIQGPVHRQGWLVLHERFLTVSQYGGAVDIKLVPGWMHTVVDCTRKRFSYDRIWLFSFLRYLVILNGLNTQRKHRTILKVLAAIETSRRVQLLVSGSLHWGK